MQLGMPGPFLVTLGRKETPNPNQGGEDRLENEWQGLNGHRPMPQFKEESEYEPSVRAQAFQPSIQEPEAGGF